MSSSDNENYNSADSNSDLSDDDNFVRNAKFSSFLEEEEGTSNSSKKRKRVLEREEADLERRYEKSSKHGNEDEEALPTIMEDGSIRVSKKQKRTEEEKKDNLREIEEEKAKPKKQLTKRELKEQRRKEKREKVEAINEKEDESLLKEDVVIVKHTPEELYEEGLKVIAVNSEKIIENPNAGITRRGDEICSIGIVTKYLKDENESLRMIAVVSLMRVFNDVLPNYPIHLQSKEEEGIKLKKEVRALKKYEESLMFYYGIYLRHCMSIIKSEKEVENLEYKTCVKCLSTILSYHYLFNLSDTISKALVPALSSPDEEVSSFVSSCFASVFRGDTQGNATYSIVQQLALLFKNRNYRIPAKALEIFISLPLKEQLSEEDELGVKTRKKKKRSEVDLIMQESEGPDPSIYKAFQKDTLQEVLLTYFRILKLEDNKRLISVVLEGLAHFGHLLNSSIVIDLIKILKAIMEKNKMTVSSITKCVLAALRLIQMVATIINIDEPLFITQLYSVRFDLVLTENHVFIPDYIECCELSFLARKEYISERVAAYAKSLLTISLQVPVPYAMACISMARALFLRYPMFTSLVDNEEGRRKSGVFNLKGDLPEQVNAHAATCWDICLLKQHYDPTVTKFIEELTNAKSLKIEQGWRNVLKKDYKHRVFTIGSMTKRKLVLSKEDLSEEQMEDE